MIIFKFVNKDLIGNFLWEGDEDLGLTPPPGKYATGHIAIEPKTFEIL